MFFVPLDCSLCSFGRVWELSGHRLLQLSNSVYGLSSGWVFKDKIFRPISAMLSPPLWPLYILRPLVLTPGFRCVCPGMLSYPILRNTHSSSSRWKSIRWNIARFYADPSCLASSSDWRWWNSFFDRLALFLSHFIIVLTWFLVGMHTQSNGSHSLPNLVRQVDHPVADRLASSQEQGRSTQSGVSAASLCATKLTSLRI